MDPLSLMKVLWRHRWLALPAVLIVILLAGYVLFFGPRVYESSATYVVVNPNTPSASEMERNKRLAKLNSDNPYLRASEPGLIVKVLVARMSAQSTQLDMEAAGLSTEYTVAPSAQSTMTVVISAFANTPERAVATRQWLLNDLGEQLHDLQKVNGANDRYLFTALPVDVAREPVEKVSSRLRSLIVTLGAGAILVMGVVAVAAALDRRRHVPSDLPARAALTESTTTSPESPPAHRGNGAVLPSVSSPPKLALISADPKAAELTSIASEEADHSLSQDNHHKHSPQATNEWPLADWHS
jgi:capsular polysaccharide biosynthesis protein